MSEELTRRVGEYEIVDVLGSGGMGRVFKVRNVICDRIEAMKILLPNLAGQPELADRFRREIKLLAILEHPNIAALRTALSWDNRLVMIMEYVEGTTLAARLKEGPLPVAEAVAYAQQVLGALAYAHARQIIHRDIKPENIMITNQGVVKLMDFGIARSADDLTLTATGTTLGSLYYMSPEQIQGGAVDQRADLYSLGVTLYEMITGQRPFKADSNYSIMDAHVQKQPMAPVLLRTDLPSGINEIILLAMAKDPAERFQSADAFRTALQNFALSSPGQGTEAISSAALELPASSTLQQAAPVPVQNAESLPPVATPYPAHRGLFITLGAVIVLVVLVAAGLYYPSRNKTHAGNNTSRSGPSAPEPTSNMATTTQPPSPAPASTPAQAVPDTAPPSPSQSSIQPQIAPNPYSTSVDQVPALGGPGERHKSASRFSSKKSVRADSETSAYTEPLERAVSKDVLSDSSPSPAIADLEQLKQVEHDFDLISSRADSVNESLNSLRDAQRAQGLGLRGDIVSSQARMQKYLARAQSSLARQDAQDAKKYLDLAEPEITGLERFLGR
jgi:serine/threonine-protein kinase